jgi:hypothetical protein
MPTQAQLALMQRQNLSAHGVAITVTRPAPLDTPVDAVGIWHQPLQSEQDSGRDVRIADPRRIMAVPKSTFAEVLDRGTAIVATEPGTLVSRSWVVDGLDRSDDWYWYLLLKRTT